MSKRMFSILIVSLAILVNVGSVSGSGWTNCDPSNDSWCTAGNWDPPTVPGIPPDCNYEQRIDCADCGPPERGPVIDCVVCLDRLSSEERDCNLIIDVVSGGDLTTGSWRWSDGDDTVGTINISGSATITVTGGGDGTNR